MLIGRGSRTPIPRAKTAIPRLPAIGLARTRLLAGLAGAAPVGVTVADGPAVVEVCAPAGYGKSTLMAQYAQSLRDAGRIVGWVSCDRHDADLPRWWTAVLTALGAALDGVPGGDDRSRLDLLEPPRGAEPAFLAEFVETVAGLGAPVTLVLDDVHELPEGDVLDTLADLLASLPAELRLVLGTRRDPSLPLHRLKLDGRLAEIRARELAFDRDEVEQILRRQGIDVSEQVLTALMRRTEGWPAAVRLAIIALLEHDDPSQFVERFAGDDRGVADYLVAEILQRLPDDTVRFLLDVSVAEELSAELAGRLSGRADAGAVLEDLEHANALVQRLGAPVAGTACTLCCGPTCSPSCDVATWSPPAASTAGRPSGSPTPTIPPRRSITPSRPMTTSWSARCCGGTVCICCSPAAGHDCGRSWAPGRRPWWPIPRSR